MAWTCAYKTRVIFAMEGSNSSDFSFQKLMVWEPPTFRSSELVLQLLVVPLQLLNLIFCLLEFPPQLIHFTLRLFILACVQKHRILTIARSWPRSEQSRRGIGSGPVCPTMSDHFLELIFSPAYMPTLYDFRVSTVDLKYQERDLLLDCTTGLSREVIPEPLWNLYFPLGSWVVEMPATDLLDCWK